MATMQNFLFRAKATASPGHQGQNWPSWGYCFPTLSRGKSGL